MACNITINGRASVCKSTIGGVLRVHIAEWDDIASAGTVAIASGAIDTGMTGTVRSFELNKNASSFNQTVTSNVENGTVFYEQSLSIVMNTMTAQDNDELGDLVTARLLIVVEDNNGQFFAMGLRRGAECTGGTFSTGQALGDLNGYTLEFSAEEVNPAPFLTDGDSAGDYGGLTFTAGS